MKSGKGKVGGKEEREGGKGKGKHRCNGRNVEEIDTSRKRTEEEKYYFGTDRSSPLFVFLRFLFSISRLIAQTLGLLETG